MNEQEATEYETCRVCGARRCVNADGRFPWHRIYRVACPGGGQFVERWHAQRERRAVAELVARWPS